MTIAISEEFLVDTIQENEELDLIAWSEDGDTELLFKLKGLREYFLTNPRKDFSTLTIDCLLIELELDLCHQIHLTVELDLFITYHAPSDDISITINQDAFRITDVDVMDMDCGKTVEPEFVEGLADVRDFAKNNAELSKMLFDRVETQPFFDKVGVISTCLRHLIPTGKPLTERYMDDLLSDDNEFEAILNKKAPTLVQ